MLVRLLIATVVLTAPALAQDDEDESRPGLWRTVRHGQVTWDSIQPDVFEQVRHGGRSAAHAPEHIEWHGLLLMKTEGTFQFHAYLCGHLDVQVGEQSILNATTDKPQWVSGRETALDFGEKPFRVRYSPAANGGSGLRLFWSSDSFPLEPLPHHLLFHAEDDTPLRHLETAEQELVAFACRRCHSGQPQTGQPLLGPSLKRVGAGTSWSALKQRLTRTEADPMHGRMPAYGLSSDDADAVLAYLASVAETVKLSDPPKVKVNAKETPSGRELIKSIGCLACHEWQGVGQLNLFGGGKLDGVGARRSKAWLDQWLRDPTALNEHHRMPVFKLTDAERQQIVSTLADEQPFPKSNDAPSKDEKRIQRGEQIVRDARCAACHEIAAPVRNFLINFEPVRKGPANPALTAENFRDRKGCLSGKADPAKFQPAFHRITHAAHVTAFTRNRQPPLMLHAQSPSLLVRKNCLACHDRDGSRGLSSISLALLKSEPQWQGQTPTLSPPPLTAVGDKLQYAAMAKAIRGEQTPRMPWLKVRMPRFTHTDQEVGEILAEFDARDRIPPNAPATPKYPIHSAEAPADPQTLLAGRELTGGKGFSCVACHALKDYVPKQVALGTRGSDLYRLGDRMRPEFFFRWTRSPLRIIPGVEMPSYQRPHATLLDGQLDRQLAAIWDALHDPNFTAPTNPAVVEQLWTLQPGDRPRIIRDVFTLTTPDGKTETVPRAFAVGFPNGHNVLFDLDRGAVRAWTIGDFARQRTQGKSWFWDLAGVTVAGGMGDRPDVVLNGYSDATSGKIANRSQLEQLELVNYSILSDRVRLSYRMKWKFEGLTAEGLRTDTREFPVFEEWIAHAGATGWERSVWVKEYDASFVRPRPSSQFGTPMFTAAKRRVGDSGLPLEYAPDAHAELRPFVAESMTFARGDETVIGPGSEFFRIHVGYNTALQRPQLTGPPAVPLPVNLESVTVTPGFKGERLALPRSIMPTAITWDAQQRLAFTSLKGHVYIAKDSDGDGLEDQLTLFAEGLAAPFGIIADDSGELLVAHKPEVVALKDADGDDRSDAARIIASGWGYTDDYHDWTTGIARDDARQWFYIGLGSDYAHKNRPANESQWRGRILRFDLKGNVESVASELRYPVGLTLTDDDKLFVSDQQGVQNCFNELNYIQLGHRYGVPAKNDEKTEATADVAAVQIPHPWTRSVNGVAFWPKWTGHPFAGQIVGAEFNQRALVRFSLQEVDGHMQGAVYPLSKFTEATGPETFLGPISVAFNAQGELYVGSLYDSGWLGGLNVGDIVKLTPKPDKLPNGIREVRAIPGGFAIDFLKPVNRDKASQPSSYKLSGYTRVWGGEYATPDSGRHTADVRGVTLSDDGRTVELAVNGLKSGHVYDIGVGEIASDALFPNLAHYTLTKIPN